MKVTLNLPDRDWAVVLSEAESYGLSTADYIALSIRRMSDERRQLLLSVALMHSHGLHDGDISQALGRTRALVAAARRELGLPVNRQFVKKAAA